ncbi:hypothetical protein MCOR27_001515 [Pyricularia oryzae]|uniref:DOMON domain-containing protein n=5 Tax=Pyricularia TaxID=48558 RepID=A0ABQ8NS59_PYRGI|nr:uncharacterized protein MGG_01255 [Pyricularia oryzae 70-15]ELQ42456.1 hypothetical protein OOU_Y34scaffold00207g21 [Pyricularia oryzae Y34]KAH8836935.1 hypothetical protein MCOR01_010583 [Pyricularia oryzae]KAI6301122.1 hypothetical protein MCOR33_003303 [Pyricularia grisea]EHA54359.1 hypothetical protein MGG_01255 [Pyricularia oryzae 70-15]KAH9438408.1 hypothetical protein MCOR02_002040 [Pyricularia oryzae]
MVQFKASGVALVGLASTLASAAIQTFCPGNVKGVCYTIGVPTSSQAAGRGNIYFQLKAPASYDWVALGTGSTMANCNIFLVYKDGRGNLTVSPRRGTRYTPPTLDQSSTAARLTLLAGSGISGDVMTANLRCSNCESWNSGSMPLNGKGSWVGAWKSGSGFSSASTGAGIDQHDATTGFDLDLSQASIQTDSNPFLSGTGGTGGFSNVNDSNIDPNILLAHGVIMAVLFVLMFPIASMLMPILGRWKAHGGFQMFNWVFMWIGFGLGIKAAMERRMLLTNTHTVLGTVVCCLLFIQPALGYAHHRHYVKHQRRGAISYVHIIYGQMLMLLGLINGGLGLELAGVSNPIIVAYAIVSAFVFVVYAIVKVFLMYKARRAANNSAPKEVASPPSYEGQQARPHQGRTYA